MAPAIVVLCAVAVVVAVVAAAGGIVRNGRRKFDMSAKEVREAVQDHLNAGRFIDLLNLLDRIEVALGDLLIDTYAPSMYIFRGVALHGSQRLEDAAAAFEEGLLYHPNDTRMLINLGEAASQLFYFDKSVAALARAEALGDRFALVRLLKTKGWSDDWYDFERVASEVRVQPA